MSDIPTHYIDTSAVIKLFVEEDSSSFIFKGYFSEHSVFFITSLCFAETFGVLKCKSKSEISQEHYFAACEELTAYVRDERIQIVDVNISDRQTFDEVEKLAKKYTLDLADAFQLVTMLRGCFATLGDDSKTILITADKGLAVAARAEGLRVWDCLRETVP